MPNMTNSHANHISKNRPLIRVSDCKPKERMNERGFGHIIIVIIVIYFYVYLYIDACVHIKKDFVYFLSVLQMLCQQLNFPINSLTKCVTFVPFCALCLCPLNVFVRYEMFALAVECNHKFGSEMMLIH